MNATKSAWKTSRNVGSWDGEFNSLTELKVVTNKPNTHTQIKKQPP